jgi:hypothetical protein
MAKVLSSANQNSPSIADDAKYHHEVFEKHSDDYLPPWDRNNVQAELSVLDFAQQNGLIDQLNTLQEKALAEGGKINQSGSLVRAWGANDGNLRNDIEIKTDKGTFEYKDGKFLINGDTITDPAQLTVFSQAIKNHLSSEGNEPVDNKPKTEISNHQKVTDVALSTTARVEGVTGALGTAVFIGEDNGKIYFVSNDHVIDKKEAGDSLVLQDGQKMPIDSVKSYKDTKGKDISLIVVDGTAPNSLKKAEFGGNTTMGEKLYTTGYPGEPELANSTKKDISVHKPAGTFVSTEVKVNDYSNGLDEGYDTGTTPGVQKGQSGGGIFNDSGQFIGINGLHSPLWGGVEESYNMETDYFISIDSVLETINDDLPDSLKKNNFIW